MVDIPDLDGNGLTRQRPDLGLLLVVVREDPRFRHRVASDWRQGGLMEDSKEGEPRGGKSEARPRRIGPSEQGGRGLDSPEISGNQYGSPLYLVKSYRTM